jgi:hypothetical protein
MDNVRYIGMPVHKKAISVAVCNFSGKQAVECTVETKTITVLDFLQGLNSAGELFLSCPSLGRNRATMREQ